MKFILDIVTQYVEYGYDVYGIYFLMYVLALVLLASYWIVLYIKSIRVKDIIMKNHMEKGLNDFYKYSLLHIKDQYYLNYNKIMFSIAIATLVKKFNVVIGALNTSISRVASETARINTLCKLQMNTLERTIKLLESLQNDVIVTADSIPVLEINLRIQEKIVNCKEQLEKLNSNLLTEFTDSNNKLTESLTRMKKITSLLKL